MEDGESLSIEGYMKLMIGRLVQGYSNRYYIGVIELIKKIMIYGVQ